MKRSRKTTRTPRAATTHAVLAKAATGIAGLDQITLGGLPRGRPTLVCGGAGCGKTLLAMQFLVNGATQHGEPGVFASFEEAPGELAANFASLGYDLDALQARNLLAIDYIHVDRSEIEETGAYDLEPLFVRLGHAIDTVGAKRVVLDTPEALFGGFDNEALLRAEIRRLFRWLKARGVTSVITAERGTGTLTRYGLEEYVSDCVVTLDHRITDQLSTRVMRVVKYRGSEHGTDEYPFLIDDGGISVLPISALTLDYPVSDQRVSTGVAKLDAMLGNKGYFVGSSVLISGTAGTGKSSLAAYFVDACCRRGERCVYVALEEPSAQIVRNMRSIGLDLAPWVAKGMLKIEATRPTLFGLELHLVTIHKLVEQFQPTAVVIDPISSLVTLGHPREVKSMLTRLFDYLKMKQVTGLFTYLAAPSALEVTDIGASSLIDTWLQVRDLEADGERNRGLYVLKSRGMAHSNQVREFLITDDGIELIEVYVGPNGVVTGSARAVREAEERAGVVARKHTIERNRREIERRRHALEARIRLMREEFVAREEELAGSVREAEARESSLLDDAQSMQQLRTRQGRRSVAPPSPTDTSAPAAAPRRKRGTS